MRKWKGLVLSVCIILYLSACGNNDTVNDEIPENFTVGIICTSGSENNSSIPACPTDLGWAPAR